MFMTISRTDFPEPSTKNEDPPPIFEKKKMPLKFAIKRGAMWHDKSFKSLEEN